MRITPGRGREVDDALARLGRTRSIQVTVPHYSSSFAVVSHGNCVATVPRRLAQLNAKTSELELFELPFALPTYDVKLHWHVRVDTDPGVTALRTMIRAVLDNDTSPDRSP